MTDLHNPAAKPGIIQMFKMKNFLKQKLGITRDDVEGEIDPKKIAEAQQHIVNFGVLAEDKIQEFISLVIHDWEKMRDMPQGEERSRLAQAVYINAHEVHDLSGMCGHFLCADFAARLRDYIGQTDLSLKAQRVISQALVDAIQVCYSKEIKDSEDPRAAELKSMVHKAVEKYG